MLSMFTLSVLGSFGVSNALTDVAGRAASDDDDTAPSRPDAEEPLRAGTFPDGLGGDDDLIARLDHFTALEMTPVPQTPTSEAFLTAEDTAVPKIMTRAMPLADNDSVAALTSAETEALTLELAAAQTGQTVVDEDGVEVIAVAVDTPGAPTGVAPSSAEAGFRTALEPDDELTLNIDPDLPGKIVAVHSVIDTIDSDASMGLVYALKFYIQPDDMAAPDSGVTGSEDAFIAAHGLQKLGEVDMGRFEVQFDPESGETFVAEDSRQPDPPTVIANRDIVEISALFS